ncbi:polysaccharide deacetylase family protein [Leifsonia sp. RAF41]|uniref:polysaccharide deacetylase family protein n=1 Tax=Leifsonia sp. RAF41 TaxID=3233056 RepID=UPI003F9C5CC2
MTLQLPDGKSLAVALTVDFDAHSAWMAEGLTSPAYLSRGDFDANVGAPRVLRLLKRHSISATWFTPTHTMETFPRVFDEVVASGHEIAAHGLVHERFANFKPGDERALMERIVEKHRKILGKAPTGYRSPAWDWSDDTLTILEDFGFFWDSSLMGNDFTPYRPGPVLLSEDGNRFEPASSSILEFPVSWYLDDFPAFEVTPSSPRGLAAPSAVLETWREHFVYAYENVPNGVMTLTVHPGTIGRAHLIPMLDRFIDEMSDRPGVWFTTLSELQKRWRDDG